MFTFIKKVFIAAIRTIKNMVIDLLSNLESVIIMSAAAVGISAMLQQIPFHYTLPIWIDAPMFIPVLSVMFIMLLVSIYQWRTRYVKQTI
jgi:hypothetical protein